MKKILSLLMLLVTIVMGAQADESAILYWESNLTAANSIKIGDFTLAITGNTEKNWGSGNGDITIGSTTYKTLKNSNGAQNTITCPDGYVATGVTFYVTTNADSSGKLTEIDGTSCEDVVTSLKDYTNPTVISKDIDNKASFTFTFSTKQVCFAAVVTYKASAPVGPVDPVFSLVKSTIKAGETAQIQVGNKGNLDGIELNNVKYHTLNAIQSLDRETGVIVLNEGFVGTVTFTFDSKSVENKYNYSENNELTLTVEAAAAGPATPTFDKAASSTIKVGEPVVITSDDGSQIYYNWSSKATGAYDEAALLGRTPKDSPASVTTSTIGTRYLYALAKKGEATSDIAIIGYTVEANPVKGLLDKTEDNVEAGTEVEAPVFFVVDAENNPSPASIAYGTATDKDVTINYAIDPASTNSGIITLKADGSGIESINTTSGGTAIVNITLSSNKDGYPIIDGEGTYTYTITVTGGEPVTVNYTKSVNIEQLVLDNGVKYDIAKEFVDNYIESASLNALDSLNDADGKFQRNEPFLGLKLKTAGAYIKVTLKQGNSLKVKLGNIGDNVKVNINGTEQEDIVKMTTKDEGYMATVYEYTAADADAVVTFTTSSGGTVVFKQIMIDEEIAQVILPYAVDMPEDAANGTVEMPASANPGDVVTIVATPADGYELDAITVTGKSSNTAYEVSADNTFIMPNENVNVTVTFKQITGINGIAEDAADAENANVKVIKNGKLYIGKYNIAGQQVK